MIKRILETWYHLKNRTAFKSFWFNFKNDTNRTLKNELLPHMWVDVGYRVTFQDFVPLINRIVLVLSASFFMSTTLLKLGVTRVPGFVVLTVCILNGVCFLWGKARKIKPLIYLIDIIFALLGFSLALMR